MTLTNSSDVYVKHRYEDTQSSFNTDLPTLGLAVERLLVTLKITLPLAISSPEKSWIVLYTGGLDTTSASQVYFTSKRNFSGGV